MKRIFLLALVLMLNTVIAFAQDSTKTDGKRNDGKAKRHHKKEWKKDHNDDHRDGVKKDHDDDRDSGEKSHKKGEGRKKGKGHKKHNDDEVGLPQPQTEPIQQQ